MIIVKNEYHQMTSKFTYDIDEEDIINEFGSIDDFMQEYEDETDKFWEFVQEHDYDREDDLWTDRKGGYDVDWEIIDETPANG